MIKRLWPAGLALLVLLVISFGAASPPERCPGVNAASLKRSAQAASDWFVRNQNADGTWLYLYRPATDTIPVDYNVVRHTGAAMGLYLANLSDLPGTLASADKGTEWALDRTIDRDDWTAIEYQGQVRTGTVALMVAGLGMRREATKDPKYDAVMKRMGRFLVAQTEPRGSVLEAYDPIASRPIPGVYSKYFTGEAFWALTILHRTFPREGWGKVADRISNYLATDRDDREDHWPPIADHWVGWGLSEVVQQRRLTDDEVDYARSQARLFGFGVRWVAAQAGPWGELARGGNLPRGGGYGVVGEALTGLWVAAEKDPRLDGERKAIGERAECIAGLAIRTQADAADARKYDRPDRVEGAWFRDGETRMDDQQHALAGLLRTIPIAAKNESEDDDPALIWLWLAALVLAVNPARLRFASSRSNLHVAAIGGAAVFVIALLADPVLNLFDVSNEQFRLSAGIAAMLGGLYAIFRRAPTDVWGWTATAPPLVIVALGAGADRSPLWTAMAMAVAVGALAGLERVELSTKLRWVSRLLSLALVGMGALLLLSGIYDV